MFSGLNMPDGVQAIRSICMPNSILKGKQKCFLASLQISALSLISDSLTISVRYGGWFVPFCLFVAKRRHAKRRKDM